jgi:hypothetical protein
MIPHSDTGAMLKQYFDHKRIRKAALARKLNVASNKLDYALKQKTIQTQFLWDLSIALEHNFFQDIAAMLPTSYSVSQPQNIDLKNKILQLEQQVSVLEVEKELLLKVLQK